MQDLKRKDRLDAIHAATLSALSEMFLGHIPRETKRTKNEQRRKDVARKKQNRIGQRERENLVAEWNGETHEGYATDRQTDRLFTFTSDSIRETKRNTAEEIESKISPTEPPRPGGCHSGRMYTGMATIWRRDVVAESDRWLALDCCQELSH